MYSFIAPRPKKLLSSEVRLALIFFTVIAVALSALYGFFLYQNTQLQVELSSLKAQYVEISEQNEMLMDDIEFIEDQAGFIENIRTENTILKEKIKNFLDLVPDEITLHKVALSSSDLILEGITADKLSFNSKLQMPLQSMFNQTEVAYTPQEDGSLQFVSRSILHKESRP